MKHALAFWTAIAVPALPLAAQGVKLNRPLAREATGTIDLPTTSPDGEWHLYPADPDDDGEFDLFLAAASGKGARQLLSTRHHRGGGFFAPDGKRVLHHADWDGNGSQEILVVRVDGSEPERLLSGLFPPGGFVQALAFDATGTELVYLADQDVAQRFELHAVALAGGAPRRLNGALVPEGDVSSFELSPTAPVAVYLADQETDGVQEVFVVPLDGSLAPRKLPIPLVAGGQVVQLALAADGAHVVYLADQEEDERFELFRIALDGGGAPERLHPVPIPGGDVGTTFDGVTYPSFTPSFDRRWILYSADHEVDERLELYSVPADGSAAPVKLNRPGDVEPFLWNMSWDSAWVVYGASGSGIGSTDVFSVPIDGSAPAHPSSPAMVAGGSVLYTQVSLDSQSLVYLADQEEDERFEIYRVPLDGSAGPVKLNAPLVPGGDVAYSRRFLLPGYYVMEDGVAYLADQEVDGRADLYFVAYAGGAPPRRLAVGPVDSLDFYPNYVPGSWLAGRPADFGRVLFWQRRALLSVGVAAGATQVEIDRPDAFRIVGDVLSLAVTPDGGRVLYQAREEGDAQANLYSVEPAKPQRGVQLLPDLAPLETVDTVQLVPDGSRVVVVADLPDSPEAQIYGVPVDGSAAPLVLGPPLGPGDFVFPEVQLTPNGQSVLFSARLAGQVELLVAPIDGSSAPLRLDVQAAPFGPRTISADGSRVAYLSGERLFTAPLDGSAPAVRASNGGQLVEPDARITPDGAEVVYRTDPTGGRRGQLWAAPSDASAAARLLSAPIGPNLGDVTRFALASDGARAVYLADALVDGQDELFSVPLDGSQPAVRLHGTLAQGRDVLDFALSPDGQRVVFLANVTAAGRFELFGVPIDGSQAPARLSLPLLAGGSVLQGFRIAPDSRRVVYRASLAPDSSAWALFSVPLLGGRGGVRLGRDLPAGTRVEAFEISADASTVVFQARLADHRSLLLATPIGGSEKAAVLVGPFPRTLHAFALSSDGTRVAWRADQDEFGVIELYTAPYRSRLPLRVR
ncbi:MAG TPA: hypothetical protein VF530_16165 [Planctomycetota bacterium]